MGFVWQPVGMWVVAALAGLIGVVLLVRQQQWGAVVVLALFSCYCTVRVPIAARRAREFALRHPADRDAFDSPRDGNSG